MESLAEEKKAKETLEENEQANTNASTSDSKIESIEQAFQIKEDGPFELDRKLIDAAAKKGLQKTP